MLGDTNRSSLSYACGRCYTASGFLFVHPEVHPEVLSQVRVVIMFFSNRSAIPKVLFTDFTWSSPSYHLRWAQPQVEAHAALLGFRQQEGLLPVTAQALGDSGVHHHLKSWCVILTIVVDFPTKRLICIEVLVQLCSTEMWFNRLWVGQYVHATPCSNGFSPARFVLSWSPSPKVKECGLICFIIPRIVCQI